MATAATIIAKSSKRMQKELAAIAAPAAEPAKHTPIADAGPITRRRIILASICGIALLAAAASFAPRGPASNAVQAALPKPAAPAIGINQRTSADAWSAIRPQDTTGSIITEPRPAKRAARKIRKRPAADQKDASDFARWYKKWYGDDSKNERRASTAR